MIKGLFYFPDVLTKDQENEWISYFEHQCWYPVGTGKRSRMLQHYGSSYRHHELRNETKTQRDIGPVIPMSDTFHPLIEVVKEAMKSVEIEEHDKISFQQLVVNRFEPGQGIGDHIDDVKCYGPVIAILSLNSGIMMELTNKEEHSSFELWLEPRSLCLLTEDARYKWSHRIRPRKCDQKRVTTQNDNHQIIIQQRESHISLIFRQLLC